MSTKSVSRISDYERTYWFSPNAGYCLKRGGMKFCVIRIFSGTCFDSRKKHPHYDSFMKKAMCRVNTILNTLLVD